LGESEFLLLIDLDYPEWVFLVTGHSLPETASFSPENKNISGDDDRAQLGRDDLKLTDERYRKLRNEKPAD
jgi:hypothetical protein